MSTTDVNEYSKIGPKHKAIKFTGKNGKEVVEFVRTTVPVFARAGNGWIKVQDSLGQTQTLLQDTWVLREEHTDHVSFVKDDVFKADFKRVGSSRGNTYIRKGYWVAAIQLDGNGKDVAHFARAQGRTDVKASKNWVNVGDRKVRSGDYLVFYPDAGGFGVFHEETFENCYKLIKR